MNHIIKIDCPDAKGLIYNIAQSLFQLGCNIESNHEFVDPTTKHFFMRTVVSGLQDKSKLKDVLEESLPQQANIEIISPKAKRVVILVTKEYHCLGELLLRNKFDDLQIDIVGVIGNHDILRELTSKFHIPFHFDSHEEKTREAHEEEVMRIINGYQPEFIVLAKYMRVLTPHFTNTYLNKIINIHHSFLPAFIGANPYKQAFERGVKLIGATAHFVNHNLDEGPIITQDTLKIDHSKNHKDLALAGKDVEKIVLMRALKLVTEDKVFVNGNKL
jgi:formyltetrahydrofolate deformylase